VSFQLVVLEYLLFADKRFQIFLASVAHIAEMFSILTNYDDALGGMA
jgi:hypothetical protein